MIGVMASAQDTNITEPRRGGKRATPPGHVKVFKTAIFKIHNPSRRKRAMLIDSMMGRAWRARAPGSREAFIVGTEV